MDDEEFLEDEDESSLGDFDLDDQDDFEEEIPAPEQEEQPELTPKPEPEPTRVTEETAELTPRCQKSAELVSPTELPVQLKIELCRLPMTADRLLQLQPGNFLQLQCSVDQGIDLVVNDERIGRGELIRIGDAVGVRVTELG